MQATTSNVTARLKQEEIERVLAEAGSGASGASDDVLVQVQKPHQIVATLRRQLLAACRNARSS